MSDDFNIFPLAVSSRDADGFTFELRRPDTPQLPGPPWGNECFWTDPPPEYCFKDLPQIPEICRHGSAICDFLDKGPKGLAELMQPGAGASSGKVVEGTDLSGLSPKLIAIIRTLQNAAQEANVDLDGMDMQGLTIKFIDKR